MSKVCLNFKVGSASFKIKSIALESYFSQLMSCPIKLLSLKKIGEGFHNTGFLITLLKDSEIKRIIMRVVRGDNGCGHDYLSDRCGSLLLQHKLFGMAPLGTCAKSFDVAALMTDGSIRSVAESVEFLHFVEEIQDSEWTPYSEDLFRISEEKKLCNNDRERAERIADYLVNLHSTKKPDSNLYMRHIRDLVGHGEMLMGIIDTYPKPDTLDFTSKEEIEKIETEVVRWRNKIKYRYNRCSRIHGDIHPFGNLRFKKDNSILALDLSREEFGEPADDLTGMSINYLFFSIWKHGKLTPPFKELFRIFLNRYLDRTKDMEILNVMAPFYAFRGIVIAHPRYYPELESRNRRKIFNFIINVMQEEKFDLEKVETYLETKPN